MLKPVLAGLAISSLCLAFAVDLRAQSGTKGAAKKKAAVQPVQAEDDEPEPPRARPRPRPAAADDAEDAAGVPATKGGKPARPDALPPVRIEKLKPEIEKLLKDWEEHTSQIQKMSGELSVFKYDHTFEVEKRGKGKFIYEAPDKGVYELRGMEPQEGEVSQITAKDGTPYKLKAEEAQRWVCNGKEVFKINDKEKSYEKATIPPENRGQNIIDGPLPFLFGMKAEKAKQRYRDFKLGKTKRGEIKLELRSKIETDARNWDTATVIIDPKTFMPTAVKLRDTTGAESVHVFKNVVVNEKRGWFDNPFKPNLWGYKVVLPPETAKKGKAGRGAAEADDVPDLDLGRTADSGTDNPGRKKAATKTK